MLLKSLEEWQNWIKTFQPCDIDLSLERVKIVAKRLNLTNPLCPVVTVAGTNGKGSVVAGLQAAYLAAGYRVGSFTSPYLFRFNEQVQIQGKPVEDRLFCEAFQVIVEAAQDIRLTQFELTTLAAFLIFKQASLDLWILEVGLGGRFDAVNSINADLAIITSIGIDHVAWLGDTREKIAIEKAGIFRSQGQAICGDFEPPSTLLAEADRLNVKLYCQGQAFGFIAHKQAWTWWHADTRLENLPLPKLALQNMSTMLMAVKLLQPRLKVLTEALREALLTVTLPGRIEVVPGDVNHIFDVSHNPAAASFLAQYLDRHGQGRRLAVFSMLKDKDILSTILSIKNWITDWFIAPIAHERGAPLSYLREIFQKANVHQVTSYESIIEAYHAAFNQTKKGDTLIVFGSFHTVSSCSQVYQK